MSKSDALSKVKTHRKASPLKITKEFLNKVRLFIFSKRFAVVLLLVFSIFLIANVLIFFSYKNKTYPKTFFNNQNIGSVEFADLDKKTHEQINLPEEVILSVKEKSKSIKTADLGVAINYEQIINNIKQNRFKLPIYNLIKSKETNASFESNEATISKKIDSLKTELESSPNGTYIELKDNSFVVIPATPLVTIDSENASSKIIEQLEQNKTNITLPHNEAPAPDQEETKNIISQAKKLNDSLSTKITITLNSQNKTLSKEDIANFYIKESYSYILDSKAIGKKLDDIAKQFGILLGNKVQATNEIQNSIKKNENAIIEIIEAPKKKITYTYCVAPKGVDESYIGALKSKLQAVYGDNRGWSSNGQISFVPVDKNCNFTVWLTAADLVPSFSSSICDNVWSCRVGNNVIINFDRWSGASPAWNGAGGSLDDYRSMVINHETGHWLGFAHRFCSGAGQTAPVMQQQSISLQGCNFNSWPTTNEIQILKDSKGL